MFDADAILTELSVDAPCGSDLEYDAAFLELEELAKGKEEAQFGATVIAGEPPDWKAIRKACLALFTRTRDLRIAIHLTRALLETEGVAGFTQGLVVLDRLLDANWEHVHPQLDPDDGNDPTMRVNSLAALIDPTTVLRTLKAAPLIDAGVAGRVSLRDIEIANGEMAAPEGEEAPTMTLIEGIFLNVDLSVLQQSAAVLEEACTRIEHIESQLTARVAPHAPSTSPNSPGCSNAPAISRPSGCSAVRRQKRLRRPMRATQPTRTTQTATPLNPARTLRRAKTKSPAATTSRACSTNSARTTSATNRRAPCR